jgi:hypothetical protein
MPAHVPHSVEAPEASRMLLITLRDAEVIDSSICG